MARPRGSWLGIKFQPADEPPTSSCAASPETECGLAALGGGGGRGLRNIRSLGALLLTFALSELTFCGGLLLPSIVFYNPVAP